MKKLLKLSLLLTLACVLLSSCEDDDNGIKGPTDAYFSNLPAKAQNFVKQHFGLDAYRKARFFREEITLVNTNGGWEEVIELVEYDPEEAKYVQPPVKPSFFKVELAGGVQVDFDKTGNWQVIDGNGKTLPNSILLQHKVPTLTYLENYHAGKAALKYDRKFYGEIITLEPNTDLAFSTNGQYLGVSKPTANLPGGASQILNTYFADTNTGDLGVFETIGSDDQTEYVAQYENGFQLRFDSNGNWLLVDSQDDSLFLPKPIVAILPAQAAQILTTHFAEIAPDPITGNLADLTRISRETIEDVIHIDYSYKYALRFDKNGNWLSLAGKDGSQFLPLSLSVVLSDNIKSFLASHQLDTELNLVAKEKDPLTDENITRVEFGNGDRLVFDKDDVWKSLNGVFSQSVIDILPTNISSFLTTYFAAPNITVTSVAKLNQYIIYNRDTIDIIPVIGVAYSNSNSVVFNQSDGSWRSMSGNNNLPATLTATLPTDVQGFLDDHFPMFITPKPVITAIRKENSAVVLNDQATFYPTLYITFQDGNNVRFNYTGTNTGNTWRTVGGTVQTTGAQTGLTWLPVTLTSLLPPVSKDFVADHYPVPVLGTIRSVANETLMVTIVPGIPESEGVEAVDPIRAVDEFVTLSYSDGSSIRFYKNTGDWRTINPKNATTPLSPTIKPTLPAALLAKIAAAGWDDGELLYLNKVNDNYYEIRFFKEGVATSNVNFDLLAP
ncbi:PepSY-like domain-containing protein [Viscerimonas tarda]